jgi:hypothetical protein
MRPQIRNRFGGFRLQPLGSHLRRHRAARRHYCRCAESAVTSSPPAYLPMLIMPIEYVPVQSQS